jgi:hypothetical protein
MESSIDSSRFEGELTFASQVQAGQGGWVNVNGGTDLSIHGDVIIDTSTALLVFPVAQAKINKTIGAESRSMGGLRGLRDDHCCSCTWLRVHPPRNLMSDTSIVFIPSSLL